jgi:hypothetical protein
MSRPPKPNITYRFQGSVLTADSREHLGDVEGHFFRGFEKSDAWRGRFLWKAPARRLLQAGDSLVLRREGCRDASIVVMDTRSQWGIGFRCGAPFTGGEALLTLEEVRLCAWK